MSEHKLDFNALKSQVTILQVVDMLGLRLSGKTTEHGLQMVGPCPISQLPNATAFKVTPERNAFICFCAECRKQPKSGGDVIELVARMRRVGHKEAAQLIVSHFKLNGDSGAGKPQDNAPAPSKATEQGRKSQGFDPREYMRGLDAAHPALKDCGVPEQTIRDFDGGYCSKGLNRGRLTLPVHDEKGEILAFMGLALKGETPAVQYPKDFTPPLFFNVHRLQPGGTLILVQSPMDVLKAWDNGLEDAICPLTPMTPESLDFLAALMRRLERTEVEWY